MEPFSMLAMTAAGIGLQAFGAYGANKAGKEYNAAQVQEIQLEKQVEDQRRRAMEVDARRKSIEDLRNAQRARSLALTNATGQGAQFGSGLQGGYGQIASASGWNQQGLSNSLEIGRNTFDLNAQVSETKIMQANAQRDMGTAQGWSNLGKSLTGSAGAFGRLASGPSNNYNPSTRGANALAFWS